MKFPAGWDAAGVKTLIEYDDSLSEEEEVADGEAVMTEQLGQPVIAIPEG